MCVETLILLEAQGLLSLSGQADALHAAELDSVADQERKPPPLGGSVLVSN